MIDLADILAIEVERYRCFAERLSQSQCLLELRTLRGDLLTDLNEIELSETGSTIDWEKLCYKVRLISAKPDETVWATPVVLGEEDQVFWLMLKVQADKEIFSEEIQEQLQAMLVDIAHMIARDYSNQSAMSGMSRELATRYEELNLVYGLDEVLRSVHDLEEGKAFKELLHKSVDFLAIDMAVLVLPQQGICIHHTKNPELTITSINEINTRLQQHVLPYYKTTNETLVVNRDELSNWQDCDPELNYKLIVSGIVGNHEVKGILVFVNAMSRPHYTNTDRRLCELLATEISKIHQTKRDPLTGLLNRSGFEEHLSELLENPQTEDCSLIFFDVDSFQVINDTWGRSEGDKLLQQIATMLQGQLEDHAIIGRLGGDEFCVILPGNSADEAEEIAENLRRSFQEVQFIGQNQVYDVTCSFGVAAMDLDAGDMIDVLSAADVACHLVKEKGKNGVRRYHPDDTELVRHHDEMYWATQIKSSLEENKFRVFGQAIIPLSDAYGKPSHYEILVRLTGDNGFMVSPAQFIPAAERYNLMPLMDRWILSETLKVLHEKDPSQSISVSVNISGQSLCEDSFLQFCVNEIRNSGIEPQRVCLEITETAAVGNLSQALKFISALRDLGCLFALDDFGSGMSSFGYLKNLPVDYLKLDGVFVRNVCTDPVDAVMVESVHNIARSMGLKTIAEYVENKDIVERLIEIGIDYGQGYELDKPELFADKLSALEETQ